MAGLLVIQHLQFSAKFRRVARARSAPVVDVVEKRSEEPQYLHVALEYAEHERFRCPPQMRRLLPIIFVRIDVLTC